jgi:RNA polymerase sigma-70 factor, ECF subfamily
MPVTSFRILPGRGPGSAAAPGDDASLVHALRQGAPGAELTAWNRFSPGVDATLRRLLGPGAERDDLLQEVFIRFFRRIGTLREAAAVRGFLTGICLRVVRGELTLRRARQWLHLTPTGDAPDVAGGQLDDEAREAVARYYRVLDVLGARDRSLFVARTLEGLTLEEVAALHDVSVSTAQRRITHATKRVALLVRRDPLLVELAERGVR